jgi:hypothetical protein
LSQEQVRSGDASATELFELGAVMLRRKFYPAATKFLIQAIEKWDGEDQDLAQVYMLILERICIPCCGIRTCFHAVNDLDKYTITTLVLNNLDR